MQVLTKDGKVVLVDGDALQPEDSFDISQVLPQPQNIKLGSAVTLYSGGKLYNKTILFTAGAIDSSQFFGGNIQPWCDGSGREFLYVGGNTLVAHTVQDYHSVFALFFDENGYCQAYNRGNKIYTGTEDKQAETMSFILNSGTSLFSAYVINANLEEVYLKYLFKTGKGEWYPEPKMITQDYKTLSWENVTGRTAVQVDTSGCWWEVDYTFTNDTDTAISGCQLPCQGELLWDSNGRTSVAFSVSANSTYSGKCFVSTNANYLVLADSAGKLKQTVTAKRIICESGIDARLAINGGYFDAHLKEYKASTGLALSANTLFLPVSNYTNESHGYNGEIRVVNGNIQMYNGTVWKQINNS